MGYHVIVELILLKINSWLARISLVAKFAEFSHFPNIPTFNCLLCFRQKCPSNKLEFASVSFVIINLCYQSIVLNYPLFYHG